MIGAKLAFKPVLGELLRRDDLYLINSLVEELSHSIG